MTRKDCILCENCYDYIEHGIYHEHSAEEECKHFKDKSRFIELPCKVGDTVYEIYNKKIQEAYIVSYYKGESVEHWGMFVKRIKKEFVTILWRKNIGETVFLTKEEAEKKLKEMSE